MPARGHSLGGEEQGSTLIELALVLPVFFALVTGFIFFAMVMFQFANLTFASRAAMRYACVHSTANAQPASLTSVKNIVAPMIFLYPPNTSTTTLNYSGGNVVGSTVTVTVTSTFQMGITLHSAASGVVTQ